MLWIAAGQVSAHSSCCRIENVLTMPSPKVQIELTADHVGTVLVQVVADVGGETLQKEMRARAN